MTAFPLKSIVFSHLFLLESFRAESSTVLYRFPILSGEVRIFSYCFLPKETICFSFTGDGNKSSEDTDFNNSDGDAFSGVIGKLFGGLAC